MPTFSRKLGDSELSYFLPSRADGVNDMYLHLGFRAPQSLVNPHRVALSWAILRLRHPLLAASVLMEPGEYDTARFVYTPPTSAASALVAAQSTLLLKDAPKDALIDAYLNGPRTLSSERVSVLILSSPQELDVPGGKSDFLTPPPTPRPTTTEFDPTTRDNVCEFDLLFCAAHFLGDGIALHTCVNDLFMLLAGPSASFPAVSHPRPGGSSSIPSSDIIGPSSCSGHGASINAETLASGDTTPLSDTALHTLLELEWSKRWDRGSYSGPLDSAFPIIECISPLPPPLESRLPDSSPSHTPPSPLSTFQRVAHDLAFLRAQARLIGGHAFARVRPSPHNSKSGPPPGEKEANIALPATAPVLTAASQSTDIPRRQCQTLVRTVTFPPALTRRVLKRCKEEGVSVAHVMFALCNVAWGRVGRRGNVPGTGWEMPMMMYSALNLRPYLTPAPSPSPSLLPGDASYWFLAVGYFNVVLPAFLLPQNERDDDASGSSARQTLFHRARLSKRQCASAAKAPLLAPYAQRMARERGERARRFARADDELDTSLSKGTSGGQTAGLPKMPGCPTPEPAENLLSPPTTPVGTRASTPPPSTTTGNDTSSPPEKISESLPEVLPSNDKPSTSSSPVPVPETSPPKDSTTSHAAAHPPKSPSTALLGLSLLGNLDAMYSHSAYAPLTLHTLTTGSRQRAGALLLFGYTFGGRLWLSLGWDGGAFGGEGGGEMHGEGRGDMYGEGVGGIVWEGLEGKGALRDKGRQGGGDTCGSGAEVVGCEGELGKWWREVVRGVGEFFGEE